MIIEKLGKKSSHPSPFRGIFSCLHIGHILLLPAFPARIHLQRPCYAIGYDTSNHYYQRYQRGELERKDTFSKRILTTEPKFVQKRRHQKLKEKENQGVESAQDTVSTSENGNE